MLIPLPRARRASCGRVAVCEPLPQRSCEAGLAAASGEACCGAVQTSGRRVGNARVLGLNPLTLSRVSRVVGFYVDSLRLTIPSLNFYY